MPWFVANLSMMYDELPFLDRFEAAARDGFKAVEFFVSLCVRPARAGLAPEAQRRLSKCCSTHRRAAPMPRPAPPGGTDAASTTQAWDRAGDKGMAAVPRREAEFRAGVMLALDDAEALNCPRVHLMAGVMAAGHDSIAAGQTHVANWRWAAVEAGRRGRDVLIEPINTRDVLGFFLNRQDQAHAVLPEVGASNLKVQMDLYHCQIAEGDGDEDSPRSAHRGGRAFSDCGRNRTP